MLNAGQIAFLDTFRYTYTAQPRTFHALADLGPIRERFIPTAPIRRYLEGHFVFELGDKRSRELMETAEGMAIRLQTA